ncbi:hypothetical protein KKD52_05900 [Myxococcota bacterium]|nr:hypothetical protein [Myxococcota bacterium]MBU1410241.1 hypothetical protein [Myxococcota bacterium]MBU1509875.1 hypothetical protein [Myxococcota bacterium]
MTDQVASLDIGSTWIKAGVFTPGGQCVGVARKRAPEPASGTGLFSADACLVVAMDALRSAVSACPGGGADVVGLACSGQRATMLVVDGSGHPQTPAVSWQVPSADPGVEAIRLRLGEASFTARTGLPFLPIFPVFRLADRGSPWARAVARGGTVMSLGDFVLGRLGAAAVTDYSLAGATGLLDGRRLQWDEELMATAGVTPGCLPRLIPAGSVVGTLDWASAAATGLRTGTPLVAAGGDQMCAVLGAGIVEPGDALISLGTSAAVLAPVGGFREPVPVVLPHVLHGQWVVEDFLGPFGAVLDRIVRLQGWESAGEMAQAARKRTIPLEAPSFVADLRSPPEHDLAAAFSGGSMDLLKDRDLTAALVIEGLAFTVARAVEALGRQVGFGRLRLAGGGARSQVLVEAIAGALERPLLRCGQSEAVLFGAACLAQAGVGLVAAVAEAAVTAESTGEPVDARPDPERVQAQRFRRFVS